MKSLVEYLAKKAKASIKKAARREKGMALGLRVARPRKRKRSMSLLKKDLWAEVSAFVRERDRRLHGRCFACKTRPIEVAAHIIPSNEGAATRYDETNLYGCCVICNGLEKWNRASWVFKHREMFGAEKVGQLYAKAKTFAQFKKHDIIAMTELFKDKRYGLTIS